MIVVALDSTKIMCSQMILILSSFFFLISLTLLGCINSGGRSGAILPVLLLIIPTAVFFLFLLSLSGKLGIVKARQNRQNYWFWAPNLRFFRLRIFWGLGLNFGRGNVHWAAVSVVVLIKISAGRGLHLSFELNSNCFFD